MTQNSDLSGGSDAVGNKRLAAIILSGFILIVLIVGGFGVRYFRVAQQPQKNVAVNNAADRTAQNSSADAAGNSPARVAVETVDNASANNAGAANRQKNNQPKIVFEASSVRQPDGDSFYFPNLAFDKNPATAWGAAKNSGIGEWLQFNFEPATRLQKIEIQPGNFKNQETWRKNNRVAIAAVEFSNGAQTELRFANEMKPQIFDVGQIPTASVKITIREIYAGDGDSAATFISEVSFAAQ